MKVVAEVTDESPGTETGANLLAALEAEDREWPVLLVTEQNRLARDSQVRLSILSRAETLGIEVVAVRR